uniref:DNA primase/helicase n=1 Tax=Pseudomonas phage Touem01 TaxID=3138548 RepID=A0AAU6W245_9VIRU
MNDHAAIDQFLAAMREQDIVPGDNLNFDGTLERFFVEGDRKGSRNGWCILHIDANPAGQFGCNKRYGDHKFSWRAERDTKPMSSADRKAQQAEWDRKKAEKAIAERKRHADAAARAQSIWAESQPATDDHPYLVRKGVKAHGLRLGKWEFVNEDNGEIFTLTDKALLVPICDKTRSIHSLQGIFPGKILGKGAGARDKDYLKNGAKIGLFHAIGRPQMVDDCPVFIICEGYATGATIHEATGHLVLVTFDTSNLLPVADAIRESKPDAIIVMAADNDQGTTKPVENPGIHFATRAASSVSGLIAIPPFAWEDGEQDAEGKWTGPTDFNDWAALHGKESVATIFEQVITANAVAREEPQHAPEVMPWEDGPPSHHEDVPLPEGAEAAGEPVGTKPPAKPPTQTLEVVGEHDDDELTNNGYFTIIGYDQDDYFFFQHEKRQVLSRKAGQFSETGLQELAPVNWWEFNFPAEKGFSRKQALEFIFRTANRRGIYDPSKVRGRGAWTDKGRAIYHHGDYLTVDGVQTSLTKIKSGYVYPMGRSMPSVPDAPMSDEEGAHLVHVASLVRWSTKGSAALMAGWVILAPICGALNWRPHIWLTGAAGSGKSTVQGKYCAALVRDIGHYYSGDSSEAGIRQDLKADALPVLIDEAESNNEKDKQRVESVIGLIRKTSTESQMKTAKGTVSGNSQHYQIRSMFCLASINVNLPTKADIDRLTKLVIKAPKDAGADNWPLLEAELNKIDEDTGISSRLLARALNMMPVILETVKVFRKAAAKHFGNQRDGDQYGTLLAGCWCLKHSMVPSELDAMVMIDDYDWSEHTEDADQDESAKSVEALLSAKIRMGGGAPDMTVFDLVRDSTTSFNSGKVEISEAVRILRQHGIIVDATAGKLMFGTSVSNLKALIEKMSAITDLRGQLLRVPGAERIDKTQSFNGVKSKCVAIPLIPILGEAKDADDGKPF